MHPLATVPTGSHPLWHFGVVAAGAVVAFGWIKIHEYRLARAADGHHPTGSLRARLAHRAPWPQPRDLYVAAALSSAAAAAIHASVCRRHFREAVAFGVFFVVAATLQAAWTVLLWYRPTSGLLLAGAAGNAAVLVLWTLTRTAGLPIGPDQWHPEAITTPDVLATAFEVVVVVAATMLFTATRLATNADTSAPVMRVQVGRS